MYRPESTLYPESKFLLPQSRVVWQYSYNIAQLTSAPDTLSRWRLKCRGDSQSYHYIEKLRKWGINLGNTIWHCWWVLIAKFMSKSIETGSVLSKKTINVLNCESSIVKALKIYNCRERKILYLLSQSHIIMYSSNAEEGNAVCVQSQYDRTLPTNYKLLLNTRN